MDSLQKKIKDLYSFGIHLCFRKNLTQHSNCIAVPIFVESWTDFNRKKQSKEKIKKKHKKKGTKTNIDWIT